MKHTIFALFLSFRCVLVWAESPSGFSPVFDALIENHEDLELFSGVIREWGFYDDIVAKGQMQTAFSALSNYVDEAVSMLPTVLTDSLTP